jgi:hypothetical protein
MSLNVYKAMSIRRLAAGIALLFTTLLVASCNDPIRGYSPATGVGDAAPRSNNRIVADADKWYEVSSMDSKVPLYRWRIADLIDQKKPFMVVFGTPQHCTMCVDQIVRVAVMEEMYGDRFAFIHVDGYKDNAVWVEWGVKGEPWTFFVDAAGIVTKVFPGQTELALLENEIQQLLKRSES